MKVSVVTVAALQLQETTQDEKNRGARILALSPAIIKKGVVTDYVLVVGL